MAKAGTWFQSAPRSRDRGDRTAASPLPCVPSFNPRPGHATGATKSMIGIGAVSYVSIRAPVTRPGRRRGTRFASRMGQFQSAPRSRDRGDRTSLTVRSQGAGFNPRPGHATGATWPQSRRGTEQKCFNPRPGHATGATSVVCAPMCQIFVSIRAPVTRPGRLCAASAADPHRTVSIRAPVTRPGRPRLAYDKCGKP